MMDKIKRRLKTIYSSSLEVQRLVKRISTSGFYFGITKRQIARQKVKDKEGPFNLVIETSNFCNARCVMCPYKIMKREKKIMDEQTFKKIIARIKEEKLSINKIIFSGLGEPLIDPNIVSRVRVFKEMGLSVKFYTNASLLGPNISRKLVELELDEINISFNGVTAEQYEMVMGVNFNKTVANIKGLIDVKKVSNSSLPRILISSIITKENEQDIKKHIDYWSGKVDSVTVSMPHEWGGTVLPETKHRFQKTKRTYPCRSLWHTFIIDSSSNFVICCRDYESKYILGNIHTHSFGDIQQSQFLEEFQEKHLKYLKQELPRMCKNCNFPYQDGIEWYLNRSAD